MRIFDIFKGKKRESTVSSQDSQDRAFSVSFDPVKTKNPEQAVDILFNRAILAIPYISLDEVHKEYSRLQSSIWQSRKLVEGSISEVKNAVLRNVIRLRNERNFIDFEVAVLKGQNAAQISAFFKNTGDVPTSFPSSIYFRGIRVLKTEENLYAIGDFDFV